MPVVMGFGLVGNILSILVLRSPGIDMKVGTLAECQLFNGFWFGIEQIWFQNKYWIWYRKNILSILVLRSPGIDMKVGL